jgi:F-type H+-transporting ATPase subunit epsilon
MEGKPLEDNQSKQIPQPANLPEEFDAVVVNMDKLLFEGKAKSIIAPAPGSNLAILPGHTPLFTKLDKGTLIIDTGKGTNEIPIEGGVAKIAQAKVVILIGF